MALNQNTAESRQENEGVQPQRSLGFDRPCKFQVKVKKMLDKVYRNS